jgi:SAM-dependent methyltransferase
MSTSPFAGFGMRIRRLARILHAKTGWWKVQCPVCRGRFRRFLPAGLIVRQNAECPQCGALERHRLQWLFLHGRNASSIRTPRILHVAPEPCFARRLASRQGTHYVTVDISMQGVNVAADITRLPFDSDTFDIILCSHVLEHVQDDSAAMAALYRVLKPGGWAMLQVPIDQNLEVTFEDPSVTDPHDRERLFRQADHVRLYGRDYHVRLTAAGFDVESDEFAFTMDPLSIRRFALRPEPIFVCRKSSAQART